MSGNEDPVVPYVGTWIEIEKALERLKISHGRSLRGNVDRNALTDVKVDIRGSVVPYVGTWIEIRLNVGYFPDAYRRSLRGNVDRNIYNFFSSTT